MKLVIVGGVAAGASAAARARRLSEGSEIVMLERGPDVSFANCGLPYHIGGVIPNRAKLLVARAEMLRDRFRIDVRVRSNVRRIDRARKVVEIENLADGRVYEESYDKLILATGAAPLKPPMPGLDTPGVFTLRTLEDMDRIKAKVDSGARRALVVGAGFIGLELVENFVARGLETTLVELQDQVLPPFDKEMTTPILERLAAHGVKVLTGDSATAIAPSGGGLSVALKSGATIGTDLVVLGIGVRPENALAVDAGLATGPRGGVKVDAAMRTSDPDIIAVGDVVEISDVVTHAPTQIPLAGPANRQGRLAVDNLFGREVKYRGTQGTAILGVFGLVAAMTGQSEKALIRAGIPYDKIYVHPNDHAGYYPGAKGMTIKLMFDPTDGKILGGEAIGESGVDRRIDVFAIAIQAGMTVFDLEQAELAYAPQFGSAKDAVNMAAFVASNVALGKVRQARAESLGAEPNAVLVDVRNDDEVARGMIPGAVHIPLDRLRARVGELPGDRPLIVYCQAGQRGHFATTFLTGIGLDARNLAGGYKTYRMVHPTAG